MTIRVARVWNGTGWDEISSVISGARVFYQNEEPSTPLLGDIWTDADGLDTNVNTNDFVLKADTEYIKYGSSTPTYPEEGMVWIDSTNIIKPITKVYNGTTWIVASGAASESGFHPFFGAYK